MVLQDVTLRDMKKPVNETGQVGPALLTPIKCNLKVSNAQSI